MDEHIQYCYVSAAHPFFLENQKSRPILYIMKTRICKRDLYAVINFYNEKLAMQYGSRALSEGTKERIRRGFQEIQAEQQKNERTNIWFIPYHIHFEGTGNYTVAIADDTNVLIIEVD